MIVQNKYSSFSSPKSRNNLVISTNIDSFLPSPKSNILLKQTKPNKVFISYAQTDQSKKITCKETIPNKSKAYPSHLVETVLVHNLSKPKKGLIFSSNKQTSNAKYLPTIIHHPSISTVPSEYNIKNKKSFILLSDTKKKKMNIFNRSLKQKQVKHIKSTSNINSLAKATLSRAYKIDNNILINRSKANNLRDGLIQNISEKVKKIVEENESIKVDKNQSKKNIKEVLYKIIYESNNYMDDNMNKIGKEKYENHMHKMMRDLKGIIKKNEFLVKDTIDDLRRLQRDNDENLTKISFVMNIVKH